ncbi:hypothetical protein D3C80_1009190 [compost metagenome]
MAVVPVGAVLMEFELVLIHAIWCDAMEAQAWDTVHVRRQDDAVPVDRGVLFQAVAHTKRNDIAFTPPKRWARYRTIDCHGCPFCTCDIHRQFTDVEIKVGARQHIRLARTGQRPHWHAPHAQPAEYSGSSQAFDEGASGGFTLHAVAPTHMDCWCPGCWM